MIAWEGPPHVGDLCGALITRRLREFLQEPTESETQLALDRVEIDSCVDALELIEQRR